MVYLYKSILYIDMHLICIYICIYIYILCYTPVYLYMKATNITSSYHSSLSYGISSAWFCNSAFWRRSWATSCRRYLQVFVGLRSVTLVLMVQIQHMILCFLIWHLIITHISHRKKNITRFYHIIHVASCFFASHCYSTYSFTRITRKLFWSNRSWKKHTISHINFAFIQKASKKLFNGTCFRWSLGPSYIS